MKLTRLSRLTVLGLMSLTMLTFLFASSVLLQGAPSALADSHSQAHSATQAGGKSLFQPNGIPGTVHCQYPTGGPVISSPTVVNGKIYFGSQDHYVYALNASNCAFVWRFKTGGPVSSSPAVAYGQVYIGSQDGKIYALNATTGALVCSYLTGGPVSSSPDVVGKHVYVGSQDSKVYAFNATTCASPPICGFTAADPVESSPTVATVNGIPTVYIGSDGTYPGPSNNGFFYALNATTCAQIWSYQPPPGVTRNWVIDRPAVATVNGVATGYFGSLDHSVFARDASTGGPIWSYGTGNYVDSSPAVVGGLLYIGSSDNKLYALYP